MSHEIAEPYCLASNINPDHRRLDNVGWGGYAFAAVLTLRDSPSHLPYISLGCGNCALTLYHLTNLYHMHITNGDMSAVCPDRSVSGT